MSTKSLIIIPTYNESENVLDIIAAVLELDNRFHVLIVDDNSPDGTAALVSQAQQSEPRIHLLKRAGKLGLGTAYLEGFSYGLKNGFEYLFEMDADFSHNPKDLLRLHEACEINHADLAIGSRYVSGGGLKDWTFDRILLSRMASLYVRAITGMPIMDSTAGFKCYSAALLSKFDFNKITCKGYAFQIEMKYAAFLNGAKIVEVPIIFKDREKGQSKMNGSIITEAIKAVIDMKRKSMRSYYKFS